MSYSIVSMSKYCAHTFQKFALLIYICFFAYLVDGQNINNQYFNAGVGKLELAQFDSALIYFKKAEFGYTQKKCTNDARSAQIRVAEVYYETARYDSMWRMTRKIKQQITNNDSTQEYLRFDLSTLLTGIYATFGNPDSSKFYLEDATKRKSKITNPQLLANYYYQASQYEYLLANFDVATNYLNSALQQNQNTSQINTAKCLIMKQKIAYRIKNYDEQRRLLEHVTEILDALKIENHPLRAKVYDGYGFIGVDRLIFMPVANENFTKALAMARKFYSENHPEIASAYNQLGISSSWLRKDSLELMYHRKSQRIRKQLFGAENFNTSYSYTNLGNYFIWKKKNVDSATYYYEKAVKIRSKTFGLKHFKLSNAYLKLSNMYSDSLRILKALKYAHLAICAAHPTFSDTANVNTNPVIGNFYSHELFLALIAKARAFGLLATTDSSLIYSYKKAIECSLKTDTLFQNAYNKGFLINDISLTTRKVSFYNNFFMLKKLYSKSGNIQYLDEAIRFSDKSKATLLFDEINIQKDSLNNINKLYKIEAFKLQKKLATEKLTQLELENIKTAYLHYEDSTAMIEASLRKKYPNKSFLSNPCSHLTSADIQKKMKENEAIISFFVTTFNLISIVVTKDSALLILDTVPEFLKIETFRTLIEKEQNYNSQLMLDVSYYLYDRIFSDSVKQFLALKKINNLILIPDEKLWNLPFEALLTQKCKEETSDFSSLPFLIKKYTISYAPSFYFTLQSLQRSKKLKYNKDILLVAPVFDNDITSALTSETRDFIHNMADSALVEKSLLYSGRISALPFTENETHTIYKNFKTNKYKPDILLRNQASEQNILNNSLNYRIIHLATHAFANTLNSDLSGILLSSDIQKTENILYGGQIKNLSLKSDLIVLSACETGCGRIVTGDGINNLSRSFAVSNVPNVIASLWKVADESTSKLMIYFYKDLLRTNFASYAESLHQAKLKLIKENTFAQPFYWAPFVLTRY